jgi:hypothetical protein
VIHALLALLALVPSPQQNASRTAPRVDRGPGQALGLRVVGTAPARHALASRSSAVRIDFDRPVDATSLLGADLCVFGRNSGPHAGSLVLSPDLASATFTPARPFLGGEMVGVMLSRNVRGIDGATLEPAGYAWQFWIRPTPSQRQLTEIASFSNRIAGAQTRIYGAAACDFDRDGYVDLATVNEVSADVRTFLNRGDGSGLYDPMLPPVPIGIEASPNDVADLDHDGAPDLAAGAAVTDDAWVLLGDGAGGFAPVTGWPAGSEPHGVALIDVEGDGDQDLVVANRASNDLCLRLNDGNGGFGPPSFFEGGVNGEYYLAVGDMDEDGLLDLVVSGRDGDHLRVLLAQGDGTFAFSGPAFPSGGHTWVVQLGDVNGDGHLDASCANAQSFNGSILLGNGAGGLGAPSTVAIGAHTVSTDLGDLDGDGDLDWVISSFGGGFWRVYVNDGLGNFAFAEQIPAPSNPSCAVLYDGDGDGDLDLALTDEIADVIVLMRND